MSGYGFNQNTGGSGFYADDIAFDSIANNDGLDIGINSGNALVTQLDFNTPSTVVAETVIETKTRTIFNLGFTDFNVENTIITKIEEETLENDSIIATNLFKEFTTMLTKDPVVLSTKSLTTKYLGSKFNLEQFKRAINDKSSEHSVSQNSEVDIYLKNKFNAAFLKDRIVISSFVEDYENILSLIDTTNRHKLSDEIRNELKQFLENLFLNGTVKNNILYTSITKHFIINVPNEVIEEIRNNKGLEKKLYEEDGSVRKLLTSVDIDPGVVIVIDKKTQDFWEVYSGL